ncbi:MAG: helix-turn-helix transcriptional regulator [Bacteroidota bacterium]
MQTWKKQTRDMLGLSQQELADYLGVSRNLYSMAEIDKRQLPTAALMKLTGLHASLTAAIEETKKLKTNAEKPDEKTVKLLAQHAKKCEWQAAVNEKKLTQMKKQFTAAEKLLETVEAMAGNHQDEGDRLWIALQRLKAGKKLQRHGSFQQALLQWKMEQQTGEAGLARQLAGKWRQQKE